MIYDSFIQAGVDTMKVVSGPPVAPIATTAPHHVLSGHGAALGGFMQMRRNMQVSGPAQYQFGNNYQAQQTNRNTYGSSGAMFGSIAHGSNLTVQGMRVPFASAYVAGRNKMR